MVVAQRVGGLDRLPLVGGTIVSQTVLNLTALAILGASVLTAGLAGFAIDGLALATVVPASVLLLAVGAAALLGGDRGLGARATHLADLAGSAGMESKLRRRTEIRPG